MQPGAADLLTEAKKLEAEVLSTIKFTPAHVSGDLDKLLKDAYAIRCPKPIDYFNRKDLIRIFNIIAKEIYGNSSTAPVVEGYGSFVMDMFCDGSDLDLSINFENNSNEVPRQKKIETLRRFAKKFKKFQRKAIVRGVQTILTARVPIVKVIDCGTGIECDLSVDNRDGIDKSHIIHAISLIDERFQKLSFLMKCWAKTHNINSSKDRTLNSISIVSLVALHLQTRNPPILPPFSALLKDGSNPAAVRKVVENYISFGQKNFESLAELFITLFVKLASVEKLWEKGLCGSLCRGSWICKSWDSRSYSISVEDFTDPSENVARAVGTEQVKTIYRHIRDSLDYFREYLNGKMSGTKLIDLLFGGDAPFATGLVGAGDIGKNMKNLPVSENQHPTKRQRFAEDLEIKQFQKPIGGNHLVQGNQRPEPWKGYIDKNMKNLPISENQRPTKRQRFVEDLEIKQFQKPVGGNHLFQGNQRPEPWKGSVLTHQAGVLQGGTFQPPAISSSYNSLPQGYYPGTGPFLPAQNQVGFGGSFNSPQLSNLVPVLNSIGYLGGFRQQPVHPNTSLEPIRSHHPLFGNNPYDGGPPTSFHAPK
ncbi:hypothetical protein QN277_025807 [Acacia crassicarpa]|uniref:Poly(A) RNA polymerase mitochondrial-like central palm domain-containing protein n=1 Tax=Acacia crassicarpa TaxID=499986 RepID=A0AAE1J9C8_9FABA|nr:hypothetical protein QN277_025807 [Acacia crassicarpa]